MQAATSSNTQTAPYEYNERNNRATDSGRWNYRQPGSVPRTFDHQNAEATERLSCTAYKGSSRTGRRAPDFVSSVESSAGIVNICGVPFWAHKVVMQKEAVERYPGDTFLTKLITRNLRGKERKGNEIFMDWQTGILAVRCHVAEGEIFTVRGFRQVTLCRLQGVYSCWLGGCRWLLNDLKLIPCTYTSHTCTWK